jgi:hypothetical protein
VTPGVGGPGPPRLPGPQRLTGTVARVAKDGAGLALSEYPSSWLTARRRPKPASPLAWHWVGLDKADVLALTCGCSSCASATAAVAAG